jgi:hypothetical protein
MYIDLDRCLSRRYRYIVVLRFVRWCLRRCADAKWQQQMMRACMKTIVLKRGIFVQVVVVVDTDEDDDVDVLSCVIKQNGWKIIYVLFQSSSFCTKDKPLCVQYEKERRYRSKTTHSRRR